MLRLLIAVSFSVMLLFNPLESQAATVSGKVVDSENKPLGKMTILLEHMENRNSDAPDDFLIRTETDKDGNFSISLEPSEKQYEVYFNDEKGRICCAFAHIDPAKENNLETIKLEGGCKVGGLVKDKGGKAVSGARVLAKMKTLDKCGHHVNVAETQLKSDGTFEFPDLYSGKYTFQIFPADLAFEEVESEVTVDLNYIDVILKDGAKICGKILDGNGKGVKGAKISTGNKFLSAVSDGEGNYSLSGIKLGECSFKVTAKGYAVPGYVSVKVGCKEAKAYQKDIVMAKTGSLLVAMEPKEEGVKIPSKISIGLNFTSENHGEWGYADLHADVKEGKAFFEDVAPGKYSVRFSSGDAAQLQEMVTIESGKESNLKFVLPKTFDLSGKVVDESGKPVKGVNLNLEYAEEDKAAMGRVTYSPGHAQTLADGAFTIKKLKAGKYKLRAEKEDFAKCAQTVSAGPDSKEPLLITLKKGLGIAIAVLEPDGKTAGTVELNLTNYYEPGKTHDYTDYVSKKLKLAADGKFRAEGLNPGLYNLTVRDVNHNYELASVQKIDAGSEDTVVTVGKIRPVAGTVVDASGKPVSGAEISVSAKKDGNTSFYPSFGNDAGKNKTGANGDFKLSLRENLKYSVKFTHPKYLDRTVDCNPAADAGDLKVVMENGCSITGKVVRGKDNSPVEGVIVRVGSSYYYNPAGREDEETAARRRTDRDGKFSLEAVPTGSVAFSVYSEKNPRPLFSKSFTIKKDQKNEIVLPMPEMISVKGKVVNEEGKPLSTHVFMNSQDNYQISHNVQADEKGEFEIKELIPGKYNITVNKEGFPQFTKIVDIKPESNEPVIITIVKGQSIKGTVLEVDGKPAVNVELMLTTDNTARVGSAPLPYVNKKLELTAEGKFEAKGLNPGKYNITVRDANLNYEIVSLSKIDTGSEDNIITLGKPHPLSVTVVDASGNPVSGAKLAVTAKNPVRPIYPIFNDNNSAKNRTGEKGDMALSFREGMKYSLRFSHPAYLDKYVDYDPAAGKDDLKVVMGKGSSVNGKVVRMRDNSPVEGVIVKAGKNTELGYVGPNDKSTASAKKTGKDGKFSLETVPSGVVSFSVYQEGQARALFSKAAMVKKEQKDEIVLAMPEMVSFTGTILDPEGNPLPSAYVNMSSENYETSYGVKANENGSFEIKDVVPGKYTAYIHATGLPGAKIVMNPPEAIEITLENAKGFVLRQKGKSGSGEKITGVLKVNGKPRSDGKIQFAPLIVGRQPETHEIAALYSNQEKSDISADGRFDTENLKPGKYLYLVRGDSAGQSYEPVIFSGITEVKEGAASLDLDIKSFSVSGAVEGVDGKSASGTVQIKPEIDGLGIAQKQMMVMSSQIKEGRYKFDTVPVGKYKLSTYDNESGTFNKNIEVKNEDLVIDIKLPKGFKFSGEITCRDSDEQKPAPLSQTFVFAYSKDMDIISYGIAPEDGVYVMRPSLNQGEYEIIALKKYYAVEGVTMKIDSDRNYDMTLVPGGDLDLTLKSDRLPVKDRLVMLKDENGKEIVRLSGDSMLSTTGFLKNCVNIPTNESGKTSFVGLKPGTYTLSVKGCKITPDKVTISPLEKTTMEIELSK